MRRIWISTTKAESWEEEGSEGKQTGSFIEPDNIVKLSKEEVETESGSIDYRVIADMKSGPSAWWGFTTEKVRDELHNELSKSIQEGLH